MRSRSTSANSANRVGHDLGLEVLTALEADVLLDRDDGHRGFGDRIEEGDDLAERAPEAPVLGMGARRGGRLHEVVNPEALAARVLEDGEALAADVLPGGGYARAGDGFHATIDGTVFPAFNLTLGAQENRSVPGRMAEHPKRSFSSDRIVAASDVSRPRLIRDASFHEADRREIARRCRRPNRVGLPPQRTSRSAETCFVTSTQSSGRTSSSMGDQDRPRQAQDPRSLTCVSARIWSLP